jgi:hypothetical protein
VKSSYQQILCICFLTFPRRAGTAYPYRASEIAPVVYLSEFAPVVYLSEFAPVVYLSEITPVVYLSELVRVVLCCQNYTSSRF